MKFFLEIKLYKKAFLTAPKIKMKVINAEMSVTRKKSLNEVRNEFKIRCIF